MALLIDILAAGVIDNSGDPLDSGVVYAYEVGTTTPVTTYQDSSLTQPHPHPIVLDSAGKAEVYTSEDVRLVIEDSDGGNIADIDAIGTNTELLGGTTTIGNTISDVVEFNSSIEGDLIPTVDDAYDVGSTSKRWAEGYFVNLTADSITGTLNTVAANTPGWVSNLGLNLNGGTLQVTDVDAASLSTLNYGYAAVKNSVGNIVNLKITYGASFNDVNGVSSLTNLGFGRDETVTAGPYRFYGYIANKNDTDVNGSDGNSVFFISRYGGLVTTPSNVNNIGDTGGIPATDDPSSILIMQNVTIANYVSLPCTPIFTFLMSWDTGPNDWEVELLTTDNCFAVANVLPSKDFDISVESGVVSEDTLTPQDIGVSAKIISNGVRPIFVGLTCDSSVGYLRGSPDTTSTDYYPFSLEITLLRDGTIIYETRHAVTATTTNTSDAAYPFDLPPGAVWTIDQNATAGYHEYTCKIVPSSQSGTSEVSCDNIKIVAFEI